MTTSHLTNPAKDAGQVIGYSHSTMRAKALHSHSAKSPNDGDISRWLTLAKSLVMSGHPHGPLLQKVAV